MDIFILVRVGAPSSIFLAIMAGNVDIASSENVRSSINMGQLSLSLGFPFCSKLSKVEISHF
jgi:hypothetical protein